MAVKSIKINECIGCGTCVESCPMDVFRLDTIAAKRPESSPCSLDCPLGLNQREYHNLIKMDMLDEAAALLQARHPMPSITGRICPHPCESQCSRIQVDEAININGLEQYLGDYLLSEGKIPEIEKKEEKVAVIGSGPAGLSCAYFLTMEGYDVTVFEKDTKPGGLLRYTLPSFRLPGDILDKQVQIYEQMGITFKTEVLFGRDITKEERAEQGF
jgi:NADPH-dependent glutamate synthase beta subunit-like oxidoreductase